MLILTPILITLNTILNSVSTTINAKLATMGNRCCPGTIIRTILVINRGYLCRRETRGRSWRLSLPITTVRRPFNLFSAQRPKSLERAVYEPVENGVKTQQNCKLGLQNEEERRIS